MKETLLKTSLYDWHMEAGAKMAPFAGFSMPISYLSGELAEIKAVRTKAGLFDISHMGQIFVSGTAAREFLNFVTVRDIAPLVVGSARYTLACGHNGAPLDDLIIYQLPGAKPEEELFLVVSNASNVKCVFKWFKGVYKGYKEYLTAGETLRLSDDSEKYALFALQGPLSESIMTEVVPFDELPQKNYSCAYTFLDARHVLVLRSGYTGEDGFEILCPINKAEDVWNAILNSGTAYGLLPAGLAARDVLRLEAGMPLYGHEISRAHDPVSAGLGRYIGFNKNCFIGKTALQQLFESGARPRLHGFVMEKGRIPRAECLVFADAAGATQIGILTSAGPSPTLGKSIAMGYLNTPLAIDTEVFVQIGGACWPAKVAETPFYKRAKK